MFGNIINDLRKIYIDNKQSQNYNLELEAKFGFYDGEFKSTVPDIHFYRLLNNLKDNADYTYHGLEESRVTFYPNNVRKLYTNIPGGLSHIQWQRKTNIRNFELYNYEIRISANKEENLLETEELNNMISTGFRERTRYKFSSSLFNIDMTEGITQSKKKTFTSYEVEIEFQGKNDQLSLFENEVTKIFKILRGTNIVYTTDIKNSLNENIGQILSNQQYINKNILVEARNIKRKDLVYGGIVGNEYFNNRIHVEDDKKKYIKNIYPIQPRQNHKDGTGYHITFKADGLRKILIIHTTGIWLVYPPYEFNLVLNNSSGLSNLNELLKTNNGTVFDGELVEPKTPNGTVYNYLAFDCLSTAKNRNNIQNYPYTSRREFVSAISQTIGKNKYISVSLKETKEITTPENFFSFTKYFLDKREQLWYKEDGLMYIPIDTVYNPYSQRYKSSNRILTDVPDTCKWKTQQNITIDFAIKWVQPEGTRQKQLELQVYRDEVGNVPFQDTWHPITSDMIDHENPLLNDVISGKIVEFAWFTGLKKFVPIRIRREKGSANREQIALDNWHDIMDPITEDDITGQSLDMVYSYHNRIKKCLYDIAKTQPDPSIMYNCLMRGTVPHNQKLFYHGINLLDIGSGRGGDVSRWFNLQDKKYPNDTGFIVAVEPNDDNRTELIKRVNNNELNNKVKILPTGGEDTIQITNAVKSFIPGGKVDVISLMLSLSFFWSSEKHLESLVNTIVNNLKPGGLIIFLTIDGDNLESYLNSLQTQQVNILSSQIKLYPQNNEDFSREVDFILPETIVGEQREYLVRINDLSSRLQKYGINLTLKAPATDEKLLSKECMLFSSLYSYGFYSNDNQKLLITNAPKQPINIISAPVVPITGAPKLTTKSTLSGIPTTTSSKISPIFTTKPIISPIIKKKDENFLPMLSVTYAKGNKIINGPAINDDTIAPLTCKWYNNLVRIATIGDGSCFIHAVLKAFYKPYQENNNAEYRISLVENIRNNLANILLLTRYQYAEIMKLQEPIFPNNTYWASTSNGSYPRLLMKELKDENLVKILRVDYSVNGMIHLFNSYARLGDEIYKYLSDIFNINVIILQANKDDLYYVSTSYAPKSDNTVVIIGNTEHYEVLAIDTDKGLKTVFSSNDPFLITLINKFPGAKKENIIIRDADELFVENFVETFGTIEGLLIPDFAQIFAPNDPFIEMYERLLPNIQTLYENKFK